MLHNFRRLAFICLLVSLFKMITGRLFLTNKWLGMDVRMDQQSKYTLFRNIKLASASTNESCVFVISFKFSHLSHQTNKRASIIPMLMITGFPGFQQKLYAVNHESGFWMGIYQWKSQSHLQAYKKSFVFRIMNKRAVNGSINSVELIGQKLSDFLSSTKY